MNTQKSWLYPQWIAHRGGGALAPENTLAAFRTGAAYGFRMYECDVKLSADGQLFLLHDDTLDRTTSGQGRADQYTFGELARLDAGSWYSPAFAGEPVPHLAAIVRHVRSQNHLINIEIKPVPGRDVATGAAVALDARSWWQDAAIPPLLSSFSLDALHAARKVAPELPRAWLVDVPPEGWLEQLASIDAIALDINHQHLTERMVQQAHAAGYAVLCYTVNDAARAAELVRWGVVSLITDRLELFGRVTETIQSISDA